MQNVAKETRFTKGENPEMFIKGKSPLSCGESTGKLLHQLWHHDVSNRAVTSGSKVPIQYNIVVSSLSGVFLAIPVVA